MISTMNIGMNICVETHIDYTLDTKDVLWQKSYQKYGQELFKGEELSDKIVGDTKILVLELGS